MDISSNNVDYINLDDALTRIGGNMGLYKRLLGRFVEGNHFDLLNNAILSGDIEEASRQAHSLKGVSANLSLVKVQHAALELEQKIKENLDYSGSLDELKQVFDITLEKIAELLA